MMKEKIIIIIILLQTVLTVYAQGSSPKDSLLYIDISTSIQMKDILYIKETDWNELYSIPEHPLFDSLRTEKISNKILEDVNLRRKAIGDTLRTADIFYCWLPYFEWLKNIDPHYEISLVVPSKYNHLYKEPDEIAERENELRTQATIIPASIININDTLIVRTSLCSELKKGDIILSINDIDAQEILKYSFRYRYDDIPTLLNYYYFHGVDSAYDVEYIRKGVTCRTHFEGYPNMYTYLSQISRVETTESAHYYEKEHTGYIKLPKFYPDNSRLFKFVQKKIQNFRKQGCSDIIIDLRNNPGGSGHMIERFLAMFVDKSSITISKQEWVKVSETSIKDYPGLSSHKIGELVQLADSPSLQPFSLNRKLYIDGITTYLLMDQGTESTAAAFCNIMQYNKGAILVGEPLLHNAYVYGDVIDGKRLENPFLGLLSDDSISTTMSDVYTLAEDGILKPDIEIPYVAKEYTDGNDAVLNELLKIISDKNRL